MTNRWHTMKVNSSKVFGENLYLEYHKALYLDLYINSLFFIVGETNVCNCIDDTGLHACDKDLMIYKTPGAIEWFETYYMKLNKDKCKVLTAGHKLEWMWLDVVNTSLMRIEHAYSGWHHLCPS